MIILSYYSIIIIDLLVYDLIIFGTFSKLIFKLT